MSHPPIPNARAGTDAAHSTRSHRRPPKHAAVSFVVSMGLLAACGADASSNAVPSSTALTSTVWLPPDTSSATPSDPTVETTPSSTPPSNGAECLIGDWIIAGPDLQNHFEAATAGFELVAAVGEIRLTFTGDRYEWTNDMEWTLGLDGHTYTYRQAGRISGSYTDAGGALTGSLDQDDRTAELTRDGQPVTEDVGDLLVGIVQARPIDALNYSCDGPSIGLTIGAPEAAGPRIPLTAA